NLGDAKVDDSLSPFNPLSAMATRRTKRRRVGEYDGLNLKANTRTMTRLTIRHHKTTTKLRAKSRVRSWFRTFAMATRNRLSPRFTASRSRRMHHRLCRAARD